MALETVHTTKEELLKELEITVADLKKSIAAETPFVFVCAIEIPGENKSDIYCLRYGANNHLMRSFIVGVKETVLAH